MSDDVEPPFTAESDGYRVCLSEEERAMVKRLVGELSDLINDPDPDDETTALISRLFPAVYQHDPEAEAEYQRLMRDELLESRRQAFETVEKAMADDVDGQTLSESEMVALMQSINSVRLVLGTMLHVSDDPDEPEVMPGFENSREYHLYGYLSWLLEWAVGTLSGTEFN